MSPVAKTRKYQSQSSSEDRPMRAVSLFSNCGAGDLGFSKAGFTFDVLAELREQRLDVARLNHSSAVGVLGDLRETWPDVVRTFRSVAGRVQPSLLSACPPCQGMSSARSGLGLASDADAGSKDPRNLLVEVIANVTRELKPKIIVVENVSAFLTRQVRHPDSKASISAAKLLIERLFADYFVFPLLVDLCDFGIPQHRRRSFLTFVRKSVKGLRAFDANCLLPYPHPTHESRRISLSEALQPHKLPSLDSGAPHLAVSDIPLHFVHVLSERHYKMISAIPPNSGGSAWSNNTCQNCGPVEADIDTIRCPNCLEPLLRPIIFDSVSNKFRFIKGFRNSSYRRMNPAKPATTITTASGHIGSDSTLHHAENRVLSPLECSVLQTFPKNFQWGDALERYGHTNIREMIGEAVPPKFTEMHGSILRELLTDAGPSSAMSDSHPGYIKAIRGLGLLHSHR